MFTDDERKALSVPKAWRDVDPIVERAIRRYLATRQGETLTTTELAHMILGHDLCKTHFKFLEPGDAQFVHAFFNAVKPTRLPSHGCKDLCTRDTSVKYVRGNLVRGILWTGVEYMERGRHREMTLADLGVVPGTEGLEDLL